MLALVGKMLRGTGGGQDTQEPGQALGVGPTGSPQPRQQGCRGCSGVGLLLTSQM